MFVNPRRLQAPFRGSCPPRLPRRPWQWLPGDRIRSPSRRFRVRMPAMFLATLFISGRDWLLPAAAALGAALLLLFWGYRRAPATGVVRAACFGLKLIGILALAACLLEPVLSGQQARPRANFFG